MTCNTMDIRIHNLEQEAYCAVLRAFKAQSDALTWDKVSLITELRKELRVSDDEHRELLSRVNSDDVIRRIREWRQGGPQPVTPGSSHPIHEVLPCPSFSVSRKKQKTLVQSFTMHYSSPVPTISRQFRGRASMVGPNHGYKRRSGPGPGRERMTARSQTKKDYLPLQNGVERKLPDDIELFDTQLLVEEVERVFDANQPDPAAVAKAKRLLKEHEQALVDAIARLGEAYDGESDGQPAHLLGLQLMGIEKPDLLSC